MPLHANAASVPRAVAINVGANTSLPGVRAPVHPDGSFAYVPIPEREPVGESVPTYADLQVSIDVPEPYRDAPVHLDPEFASYPYCEAYTYGDDHGVKAAPLLSLDAGDVVAFYATLETVDHGAGASTPPRSLASIPGGESTVDEPDWRPPSWGAYVIGAFVLDRDPIDPAAYEALPAPERERLANNAHVKREPIDAEVFVLGDPDRSALFERAVPLSAPSAGVDANALVTELSADSGAGPWWRRPLRFDRAGTESLLELLARPVAPQ